MTKAYLVAMQRQGQYDWEVEDNIHELAELATDAGLEVAGAVVQRKTKPEASTFIGKGKAQEIALMLEEGDMVIFDDELSPAQQGNLSELMDAPVIDRTQLILDIFAQRAHTKEGKIQVELAQLNYLLPRLSGRGEAMSRLGGGIGTRGPGETKLETDRRRIRKRIADLDEELEQIRKVRANQRLGRERLEVPMVSLVGYTNAGKSTLLSALTGDSAFVADQLFATLDPTVRRWDLQGDFWVFLSDTVGFIRKLPHTLIAAFRATLEEVLYADVLLHVIDASHPKMAEQKRAVESVLKEIGANQPVICVYNKIDKLSGELSVTEPDQKVSAVTGKNLDKLARAVYEFLTSRNSVRTFFFSFESMKEASRLRGLGKVLEEEYKQDGLKIKAEVHPDVASGFAKFEVR